MFSKRSSKKFENKFQEINKLNITKNQRTALYWKILVEEPCILYLRYPFNPYFKSHFF